MSKGKDFYVSNERDALSAFSISTRPFTEEIIRGYFLFD